MPRRSKLEICTDVLRIIKEGASSPTRIMYGANLSWKPLQQILRLMVSQGLIEEIDTRRTGKYDRRTSRRYRITQKGEDSFRYLSRAKEVLRLEEAPTSR